ncbi:MAG: Fic family protein [Bacteroidia bacterium]|nr:Fic family protein [Bacteroidia bacterium]
MPYNPSQPYNELPDLPQQAGFMDEELSRLILITSRSLAELKGLCVAIPDPQILIQMLVVQESRESSAIENIVTTKDELYQAMSELEIDDGPAKEVLRYREALYAGLKQMQETKNIITTNTLIEIVRKIKNNDAGLRNQPGTVLKNGAGQVVYTPPCCEDVVREKMSGLERFINENEGSVIDPLLKMAMIHYQFEAIHPFADGNGRTGRILNLLFLVQQDLLTLPVLYLSEYINNYKTEYYRLLREVTEGGNWKAWCVYILRAVHETALLTIGKIRDMRSLMQELEPKMKEVLGSGYDRALLDLMFTIPYLKIELLERMGFGHRQTVSKYLNQLNAAGIVKEQKAGKTKYFINYRLLELFGTT